MLRSGNIRFMFLRSAVITAATLTIAACGSGASFFSETPTTSVVSASTAAPIVEASTTTVPETTTTTTVEQFVAEATSAQWSTYVGITNAFHGLCGEWHDLAISIGWPEEEWPTLSYVLHRESRCHPDSYNGSDPSGGSRGLLQINGFWCRPSQYSEAGWLQDQGVLTTCDDLYNPETNLRAGLAIWQYGEKKHGCGWRGPWATSCSNRASAQK